MLIYEGSRIVPVPLPAAKPTPNSPRHKNVRLSLAVALRYVTLRYAEAGNTVRAINKVCILDLSSIQV